MGSRLTKLLARKSYGYGTYENTVIPTRGLLYASKRGIMHIVGSNRAAFPKAFRTIDSARLTVSGTRNFDFPFLDLFTQHCIYGFIIFVSGYKTQRTKQKQERDKGDTLEKQRTHDS